MSYQHRLKWIVGVSIAALLPLTAVGVSSAAGLDVRVNFQSETAPVPAGYLRDYGLGFDATRGYGWIAQTSSTPKSIVGRGRDRNATADQRLDTLVHAQTPGTARDPARWEHAVANGQYDVTVASGDAGFVDSTHWVAVENVVAINNFTPTSAKRFATATVRVGVTDGRVTLNFANGVNTKIDYVTITSVPGVDTTPPVVSLTAPANGTTVSGGIVVQATATDDVGVTRVEFLRDDALTYTDAAAPYCLGGDTNDVCATVDTTTLADGPHTFAARAFDAANHATTSSAVAVTVSNTAIPSPSSDINVNFQSETAPVPPGYVRDYGLGFDATRGYGWIAQTSSTPKSIVGRGRDRNLVADQRLDTLMHAQIPGTALDPARWELALAPGDYEVTLGVGDPSAVDSTHRVSVEGVVAINGFVPSTANRFATTTLRVRVSDGRMTLDSTGGVNTKLDYVQVRALSDEWRVIAVEPADGATDAPSSGSVTLALSHTIDNSQAVLESLQVVSPDGAGLPGTYNGDAAGSLITFTPSIPLALGTTYTVRTTSALVDDQGVAFQPFTSRFTTTTQTTPPTGIAFTRVTVDSVDAPTVVTLGPDGNLYVATGAGIIRRYELDANGQPTGGKSDIPGFAMQRTVLGLAFDPRSTPTEPILWVSHGAMGTTNMPNFTGVISVLTGAGLSTRRDVITGLPRAASDHMNNGIAFGPDGRLYVAQGSLSGYGAPDPAWGNRAETPLSAAVLVADVVGDPRFGGTVDVNTNTGYDASAASAPVKVHASGLRNPYDLVWHSNGSLYSPVNESVNGNAPAGPNGSPPALANLPAGDDFLARVLEGRYYGHPNPSRAQYVLNGGNPTTGVDPFEVTQYPVGVQPDTQWQAPVVDLGLHRSADGITEYRSGAFGGALEGNLLIAEFSGGDDIIAVRLAADGSYAGKFQLYGGLNNPLDVTADPRNGAIWIAEYGAWDGIGTGGLITLLLPAP